MKGSVCYSQPHNPQIDLCSTCISSLVTLSRLVTGSAPSEKSLITHFDMHHPVLGIKFATHSSAVLANLDKHSKVVLNSLRQNVWKNQL